RIRSEVNEGMEKQQRDFLLRQQLNAIRKELGEEGGAGGVDDYRSRLAEAGLPEAVAAVVEREIDRLERMSEQSPEHGWARTYVGAQPGRIARAMKEAGVMNPVMLLDEVDKVGSDWRGDPASALLEVLDPAQNHTFRDHYLEVDLDLSDVVFLATANVIETIPGPLLD